MVILEKSFSNQKFEATYYVEERHNGIRLDQFLMEAMASFSRQQIKKKIAAGEIKIINRPSGNKPSSKLYYEDKVYIVIPRSTHEDEYWNGEKLDLIEEPDIIFEDEDIIVISKPPYMVTHPTGKHLFNCATVFFESKYKHTIHSIHRLDRETSGVLLLGKNPNASNKLTIEFENENVKKCYFWIAVDQGQTAKDTFAANQRLGSVKSGRERVIVNPYPPESSKGKRAQTKFHIVHRENGYALGLAFPQTGRQHQIRVHAQVYGFPLVGDKLYLGGYPMFQRFKDMLATDEDHNLLELPRHALHALALNLPYEGKRQTYMSHLPHDFKEWIHSKLTISTDELEKELQEKIDDYFGQICLR